MNSFQMSFNHCIVFLCFEITIIFLLFQVFIGSELTLQYTQKN